MSMNDFLIFKKIVSNSGGLNGTTRFFIDGIHEIEEQDGVSAVVAQYVYGRGVDEILTMTRTAVTSYFHRDSLGSIESLTNSSEGIVERTTYDAYGRPVQSVDPGLAIAGIAAAGLIGYALADSHGGHRGYGGGYGGHHGGHHGRSYCHY